MHPSDHAQVKRVFDAAYEIMKGVAPLGHVYQAGTLSRGEIGRIKIA